MKIEFAGSLIRVPVAISGRSGEVDLVLLLDTGAAVTVINARAASTLGLEFAGDEVHLTTANANIRVPLARAEVISAFGVERRDFPVAIHSLPPGTGVDGLLGMDFLDGLIVVMNLDSRWIDVRKPK